MRGKPAGRYSSEKILPKFGVRKGDLYRFLYRRVLVKLHCLRGKASLQIESVHWFRWCLVTFYNSALFLFWTFYPTLTLSYIFYSSSHILDDIWEISSLHWIPLCRKSSQYQINTFLTKNILSKLPVYHDYRIRSPIISIVLTKVKGMAQQVQITDIMRVNHPQCFGKMYQWLSQKTDFWNWAWSSHDHLFNQCQIPSRILANKSQSFQHCTLCIQLSKHKNILSLVFHYKTIQWCAWFDEWCSTDGATHRCWWYLWNHQRVCHWQKTCPWKEYIFS